MLGWPLARLHNFYLLKVNNGNIRTRGEICSKLTMKTPDRRHWHRSGVFIVNFEHISHFVSVSIVNFEHVIAGWVKVIGPVTQNPFYYLPV